MEGRRDTDRLCTNSLDGINKACVARVLELRDAMVTCMGREHLRDLVNGENDSVVI